MAGFKNMRGQIKRYRASGKMFGQTMHTGTNWGKGYRPEPIECNNCKDDRPCVIEWYTDPCPKGMTFEMLRDARDTNLNFIERACNCL